MARERLVVIGGVAAGMSAASRARRRNPEMDIVVLEKGQHVSYGACGLPFYLSGEVKDWRDLVVYTPEFFREKRSIDVQLGCEALEIEPGRKTVHARRGSQPIDVSYDKLVIATGGVPAVTIPGADLAGVFQCSDLTGAIRLHEFLDTQQPRRAVVIGSGYIGLECADAFARRGIEVTVLGRASHLLEGFEPEIAEVVETTVKAHGVRVIHNCAATSISRAGDGALHVHHASAGDAHASEAAELVLIATGIVPHIKLAESAGVRLGLTGAIAVDERMQTSANSIYAAGDCVETQHLVSGKPAYFPLGTT